MSRSWAMLRWSLNLDWKLLFEVKGLPFEQKIFFIILKYLIYLKNRLWGWTSGVSSAMVFGERFYYNEVYGISSLQRVYCEHHLLRDHIKPGACVVDLGANIGQFHFFSRQYLKAAWVISVEPVEESFSLLKRNALVVSDCYQLAISDKNGHKRMFVSTVSSALNSYLLDNNQNMVKSHDVSSRMLDDFVKELSIKHIDLLKIDTEGSEGDILVGGVMTLAMTKYVSIEMSVFRPASASLFAAGKLLEDLGFRLIEISAYSGRFPSTIDALFVRSVP